MSGINPINRGGVDDTAVVALIEQTVDASYIFVGLEAASQQDLIDALGTVNGGLGAKIDKVQTVKGTPFIEIDEGFGHKANVQFEAGGGGIAVRLFTQQDSIYLDAGYAIVFDAPFCTFPQGINWDLGGQSAALTTVNVFSLTTAVTNATVFSCGTGQNNTLRSYDNTKHTIVVGAAGMTTPIFSVKRTVGTVTSTVFQVNDVPRPSAATLTTLADLKAALVTLGYLDP